jgi:methionine synthase II (cobalamin-independent)
VKPEATKRAGFILAREEAAAGRISRARFKVIEDRAVEDAIRLQVAGGLSEGFVSQLQFSLNLAAKTPG